MQIFVVPLMVPAFGAAVTVTDRVAATENNLRFRFSVTYSSITGATPATMPVVAFTVAMPGAEELHVPPGTDEENVAPSPTQMPDVPDKIPGFGGAVLSPYVWQ
jgi:hypothetical protein